MGWLRQNIENWTSGARLRELHDFTEKAKNHTDMELGTVVAMATACRLIFQRAYSVDLLNPPVALAQMPFLALEIGRHIKAAQAERNFAVASGMMVWLHTVRAVETMELLPAANDMWSQLSRGFPYVQDAAALHVKLGGRIELDEKFAVIPAGIAIQR
jgi:hypothetical protein